VKWPKTAVNAAVLHRASELTVQVVDGMEERAAAIAVLV
jgi:hypothetical protein